MYIQYNIVFVLLCICAVTSDCSRRNHKGWDYRSGYIENTINDNSII